ncbi:MAG: phosphate-starvation-inducible PsiE family protein [Bacteroidota bacterium]|jgi:uncharacterized membrane protein (DUF373 family)
MEYKLIKTLKSIAKIIILALMIILIVSMLLGTVDLAIEVIKLIVKPNPYYLLINVEDLYNIFSVILIIVVGYEMFKSMTLILHQEKIPVKAILQIAMIALANKVITLNLKNISLDLMIGLGMVIAALGVAFFFFNKSSEKIE